MIPRATTYSNESYKLAFEVSREKHRNGAFDNYLTSHGERSMFHGAQRVKKNMSFQPVSPFSQNLTAIARSMGAALSAGSGRCTGNV